jgi:hypothetical protein
MFKIKWHQSFLWGLNSCIIYWHNSKLNWRDVNSDLDNLKHDVNIAFQKLVQK